MSEDRLQDILVVVQAFGEEIKSREQSLKKPIVVDLFPHLIMALKSDKFTGTWNKRVNQQFFVAMGAFDADGNLVMKPSELFRVGVGLGHILKHLRDTLNLRISHWPTVNLYPRQHLSVNKKKQVILHIDEFHTLLRTLLSKGSNINTTTEVLCSRLILGMIALDGVVTGLADRKIASLTLDDIQLGVEPYIALPMGKSGTSFKQYFIGEYALSCLKYLLQRARKDGTFFPRSWPKKQGHKKTVRRRCLEDTLHELWHEAYPDRKLPEWLDVKFWIRASQQSLEMLGVPYVCIAHLRNKVRGAQLPMNRSETVQHEVKCHVSSDEDGEDIHAYLLLDQYSKVITAWDKKTTLGDIKGELEVMFRDGLEDWVNAGQAENNEQRLAEWLNWMVVQREFSKMTLSTFEGYIFTIKSRVLPHLGSHDFLALNKSDWEALVEDVAQNQDYMPSSRRQALTHLERFHAYLRKLNDDVPTIDFRDYRYRVYREYPDCDIIYPHEVDELLKRYEPGSGVWLGILFGFYCGLRCEEICYLLLRDLEDEYRLTIGRSKLSSSRRTLPYGLLIPPKYMEVLRNVLEARKAAGEDLLIYDASSLPISPDTLSKRVGRALKKHGCRVQKMHALRHGFASWQLVRYFMLVDERFRADVGRGDFRSDIDPDHPWFSKEMLTQFAEIMGGMKWVRDFSMGQCRATSTDMIPISKLLGHVNRFTTLENYSNSLGWISRYYLSRRNALIAGCNQIGRALH